jgi:hypothetical protein
LSVKKISKKCHIIPWLITVTVIRGKIFFTEKEVDRKLKPDDSQIPEDEKEILSTTDNFQVSGTSSYLSSTGPILT